MNDKINPEKTPSTKNQTDFSKSWFSKYILNNRYTGALMVGILIVIFVSLFTRVSYLLGQPFPLSNTFHYLLSWQPFSTI